MDDAGVQTAVFNHYPSPRHLQSDGDFLHTNGRFPKNPNLSKPTGLSQIPCTSQLYISKTAVIHKLPFPPKSNLPKTHRAISDSLHQPAFQAKRPLFTNGRFPHKTQPLKTHREILDYLHQPAFSKQNGSSHKRPFLPNYAIIGT